MDERRILRLPLIFFCVISAILAVAAFFALRGMLHDAHRQRLAERDLRLNHEFRGRIVSRFEAARLRLQGAELLIAATPPSAQVAAKALAFTLREGNGESRLAAVVLDERGKVLASRRRGGVPPAGRAERALWRRSVGMLRLQAQKRQANAPAERFHIEAGALQGVPVLFFAVPSPSTKGYWGVVFSSQNLLTIDKDELGRGESVFLLSEPDQTVLYARRDGKFLFGAIGAPFEKKLSAEVGIPVCCDAEIFNTLHEGQRWMTQTSFSGGTRELRLVRVADRSAAARGLSAGDRYLGGGIFVVWAVLVGAFAFWGARGRPGGGESASEAILYGESAGAPASTEGTGKLVVSLTRLGEAAARGEHFRDVISLAAREGAGLLGTRKFYAGLYDEAMAQLVEVCSSGMSDGYLGAVAMGSGDLPERIAVRERDIVEVTSIDDWEGAPTPLREEGVKAAAVFPLRAGDRIVGVLSFYFDESRELAMEEVDGCTLIALQGAVAVAWALCLPGPSPAP